VAVIKRLRLPVLALMIAKLEPDGRTHRWCVPQRCVFDQQARAEPLRNSQRKARSIDTRPTVGELLQHQNFIRCAKLLDQLDHALR
jgi:hypothetical protein